MAKYTLSDLFIGNFPISQLYGANPQNYPMFTIPGHEGVDWATPTGVAVIAPFDGIMLRDTLADKDYGNFLVCWDPKQKCAVWYCHLQTLTTNVGESVFKGELIGYTNNTGHSTGPHLHVNFVETDAVGNRLNKLNGKQGFLNILDKNLVGWNITNPQEPKKKESDIIPKVETTTPESAPTTPPNTGASQVKIPISEQGTYTDIPTNDSSVRPDSVDTTIVELPTDAGTSSVPTINPSDTTISSLPETPSGQEKPFKASLGDIVHAILNWFKKLLGK